MVFLSRTVLAFVCAVSAYYFTFWMGGAFLSLITDSPLPSTIVAAVVGVLTGRYVWQHASVAVAGLITTAAMGAIVTGAIGFAAGFFGPMILAPGANQGPLLGIFITGPLGFVLGGIGGAVYWLTRRRSVHARP